MNRKQKKELRRRLSTRQLMGIDHLTEHGLKTAKGELVFFLLSPDNLSVLSADGVRNRVRALTDLLRSVEAAELLALDSRESFQSNKNDYQTRLEQEAVPAIREMLRQRMAHLDDIQSTTASAREFALAHRIDSKSNEDYSTLKQLEKRVRDCGFHVRMADKQDVKRLLAVYYQQDVTTEHFDSFNGEEDAIIHNAQNKNRMDRGNTNNIRRSINAEANLQDVESLITTMRRNKEPLVHCAEFIELCARDADGLRVLRDEVSATLTRSKLSADQLFLVQRNGFLASNPAGSNGFASQFERVLPASSVANLFPFNYSGKNDPNGFYIGRDRYGSNIILDLDRRAEDKTNANVLILGNSGQGKSFLLKLLLCNILASGKSVICLDAEHELDDLCRNMGGCFADVMSGQYIINPLEPKLWNAEDDGALAKTQRSGLGGERRNSEVSEPRRRRRGDGYGACDDDNAPAAFRQRTRLSQHISFLEVCAEKGVLPDHGLSEPGGFRRPRRPGDDPAPLRYSHPPAPLQRRKRGQAVLHGQPPAGGVGV